MNRVILIIVLGMMIGCKAQTEQVPAETKQVPDNGICIESACSRWNCSRMSCPHPEHNLEFDNNTYACRCKKKN